LFLSRFQNGKFYPSIMSGHFEICEKINNFFTNGIMYGGSLHCFDQPTPHAIYAPVFDYYVPLILMFQFAIFVSVYGNST